MRIAGRRCAVARGGSRSRSSVFARDMPEAVCGAALRDLRDSGRLKPRPQGMACAILHERDARLLGFERECIHGFLLAPRTRGASDHARYEVRSKQTT